MVCDVRKGDTVVVIAGKEKGKSGRVLRLLTKKHRVVIERINMVKRHTKPTQRSPQGRHPREGGLGRALERRPLVRQVQRRLAGRAPRTKEGQKKRRVCVKCGTVFETA